MDTVVYHKLGSAIRARYIRFRPTAWHGHISMRVEVYGCEGSDGFRYGIYWYSFRFSFLQNISTIVLASSSNIHTVRQSVSRFLAKTSVIS